MKKSPLLILASCFSLNSIVQAHPTGHDGGLSETITHLVSSPYHVIMMLSGVAAVAFVLWRVLRPTGK